jgi:hypothetical protein
MLLGLASEALGYIARILININPFYRAYFLRYLTCLTFGPVFIVAAIYLCLGRIIFIYGEKISRIRPRSYTLFFMGCDVVSLAVQAVGGGIAASAPLTNQPIVTLPYATLSSCITRDIADQSRNSHSSSRLVPSSCKSVRILCLLPRIPLQSAIPEGSSESQIRRPLQQP